MLKSPGKCTDTCPTVSVWKNEENFQVGILHQQILVQRYWNSRSINPPVLGTQKKIKQSPRLTSLLLVFHVIGQTWPKWIVMGVLNKNRP